MCIVHCADVHCADVQTPGLVPPPALSSRVPAKTEIPNLRQSYISYIFKQSYTDTNHIYIVAYHLAQTILLIIVLSDLLRFLGGWAAPGYCWVSDGSLDV